MTVAFISCNPEKMSLFEGSKGNKKYQSFREQQLQILQSLIHAGCTDFISGTHMAFEIRIAEDILTLQKENKSITLECVVPFPEHWDHWSQADQNRRYKVITHANTSVMLSDHYCENWYSIYNRYMIDKADVVVFAFSGHMGELPCTVNYAQKQNKIVIQIDPTTAQIKILNPRTFD